MAENINDKSCAQININYNCRFEHEKTLAVAAKAEQLERKFQVNIFKRVQALEWQFLATLVALHFTPVSK